MNLYVLDTDTLSLYQSGHPAVCERCAAVPEQLLALTIISVEEQFLGWHTRLLRARDTDELAQVYQRFTEFVRFVRRLQILSFTAAAAARYERLKGLKLNVGKMDLRIAGIALETGAVVVTRNKRDFQRVPGLLIEDWTITLTTQP
jgi:tRNA(fMet)-specific endonuclease VapC